MCRKTSTGRWALGESTGTLVVLCAVRGGGDRGASVGGGDADADANADADVDAEVDAGVCMRACVGRWVWMGVVDGCWVLGGCWVSGSRDAEESWVRGGGLPVQCQCLSGSGSGCSPGGERGRRRRRRRRREVPREDVFSSDGAWGVQVGRGCVRVGGRGRGRGRGPFSLDGTARGREKQRAQRMLVSLDGRVLARLVAFAHPPG